MKVENMTGGTNRPGVPPAAFAMPPGLFMRYDLPAPALRPFSTGYAIYGATTREPRVDWFLPAPMMVCIYVDAGPVELRIRNRTFAPLPEVALHGPTSRAFRAETRGGINVGVGLTALGWSALSSVSAESFHNLVVPFGEVVGEALARRLRDAANGVERDADLAAALDAALAGAFTREDPWADSVAAMSALTVRDGLIEVEELARLTALTPGALRRLAKTRFGMPPKLLLRRARFLRSYLALKAANFDMAAAGIDTSYHDASHFLRDANTFLGMTPRRLEREGTTFMNASIRARAAVLGPPTQALHGTGAIAAQ